MAPTMHVLACCVLSLSVASAQFYTFCNDGISKANFAVDSPIEVVVAQAPLFSTNPSVGDKLGWINLYHSCIIFRQGIGEYEKYWTLEFDFAAGGNVMQSVFPNITEDPDLPGGNKLTWKNDARYCLTEGLKWGRTHWSKRFDVATTITKDQADKAFTEFIAPVNASGPTHSQYQLFRVSKTLLGVVRKTFVYDMTCNDGPVWFLHYLRSLTAGINAPFALDFNFSGTVVEVKADSVSVVDVTDPVEVSSMVSFYKQLAGYAKNVKHMTPWDWLKALAELEFEQKYVYDTNNQVYYKVKADLPDWIAFKYYPFPLEPPPWLPINGGADGSLASSMKSTTPNNGKCCPDPPTHPMWCCVSSQGCCAISPKLDCCANDSLVV